ncbi:hypothetical protein [Pandoraea sp. NPDC087047]|uniref:hypothetical protein n=1 Tax=Pandoraea sp. NPDC087047 TaxID=3364390 RepID=UPI00380C1AF1
MLSGLPSQLTNTARMQAEFDFDALAHEFKAPYLAMGDAGRLQFLEEVMTTLSHTGALQEAMAEYGMQVVPNDGRTPQGVNNCFLLSVLEHIDGLDRSQLGALADHFRDILVSTPELRLKHGERLSAGGAAARQFVELINSDPSIEQKLNVEVLSMVGGHLVRDRIDAGSPSAKTVLIIDHGGHFEAVRDAPQSALAEDTPAARAGAGVPPHEASQATPHAQDVATMSSVQQTHWGQMHLEVAHARHKALTRLGEALQSLTRGG